MLKNLDKKKIMIIAGAFVGLIVLIIIILLIFHALKGTKNSYRDIENKVLKAAKKYYSENKNLLPQNVNEQISIDDVTLTSLGYLKDLNDMTEEGVTCSAKVTVSYNNSDYRYTPLLDCGDKYKSQTIFSYIEENEKRVFSGSGLYDLNGEYVYRGETPNNYINLSGELYRIVKLTEGHVVIIADSKVKRGPWDNRYNDIRRKSDGINDYKVSRIQEYLNNIYNDEELISKEDKQLLYRHNAYIGKRGENDNFNDGSIEKSDYFADQYLSVLPLYDYINASIDNNCNSARTNSCRNYNYLNYYRYNWWTSTADNSNTFKVYRIQVDGTIELIRASSNGYIRPVIYLVSDALYVSGDGTKDNPYEVK